MKWCSTMTDEARKILESCERMRELKRMKNNESFKDLAVDIAFNVLEDNEDGIYIMCFPYEKYDLDTISNIFRCISDTLSSKKLVAMPSDIGVQQLSKEQAKKIAEELLKYAEE